MAGSIDKLCERMRYWCEDANLGYDQGNRWDIRVGGESNCSSLTVFALREAGFDTGNASFTGDLSENLTKRGWERIPFRSLSQIRKGDILLNDACHVCVVISGSGETAKIAQASIDERGKATGGQSGDQTGKETNIRTAYVYDMGWDCILRWVGENDKSSTRLTVDGVIGRVTVSEWQSQCGTEVDGCVSGQLKDCQDSFPALTAVTFEGTGSALMQEVQRRVGIGDPSGRIWHVSIERLQATLIKWGYSLVGATVGTLDYQTAMAIQQSLNDKRWEQ